MYPPPSHQSLMLTDMDPCEPQRVCYPCSGVLLPKQEELRRTMSKASQVLGTGGLPACLRGGRHGTPALLLTILHGPEREQGCNA